MTSLIRNKQTKEEMKSKKSRTYHKLLLHFLTSPCHNGNSKESPLARKGSFEYMELTGEQENTEHSDYDEAMKQRPLLAPLSDQSSYNRRKRIQKDHHDNVRVHTSRLDASYIESVISSHDENEIQKSTELKDTEDSTETEVFLNESKGTSGREDIGEEYDILSSKQSIQEFDGLSASEDEWSTRLIEGSPNLTKSHDTVTWTEQPGRLVTCLNDQLPSNENEPATTNYDDQRFTPTLASIDEDEEDRPLDDANMVEQGIESFNPEDDSEEVDSSQAPECSLRKSSTINDSCMDECEDSGNLTLPFAENIFSEDFDKDEPELAAIATDVDMTSNDVLQTTFEDNTDCHNDESVTSQSPSKDVCEHISSATVLTPDYVTPLRDEPTTPRTPILRPESPPVVVVDSLEDYVKTVVPEHWYRTRSRRSSNNTSYRSSLTDSAYSSRERLNALHHSSPDITLDSCDDDIDLQYLPVSYADVRVRKRKKWVKRSTSDVHDNYYFSGEAQGNKLNTLKRQLARKLSRRHRKPAEEPSQGGANDKPQNTLLKPNDEKLRRKPSRTDSIRDTVRGIFRRIRDKKHRRKENKLKKRTRSLPTQLDSCSSFDYYITDSETTTET